MSDLLEVERFNGNYIRLTIEEKDGKTYERIYLRSGVSVIILLPDNKVRFIQERSYWSNHDGKINTKLVTGYVDDNETPLDAAKRELKSETGLIANKWHPFHVSNTSGMVHKTQTYFIASDLERGLASPEESEKIIGYEDLTCKEVKDKVLSLQFGTTETAFALLKLVS